MKNEIKLHAMHETKRATLAIFKQVISQLKQSEGKKVIKKDMTFFEKFKPVYTVPEITHFEKGFYSNVHYVNFKIGANSIHLEVSCCFQANKPDKNDVTGCFYEKEWVWIADLKTEGIMEFTGIIEAVNNDIPLHLTKKTTITQQTRLINKYNKLREECRKIEKLVWLQGELKNY